MLRFVAGVGTPLHKPYRYVPPKRLWFWGRFVSKTGIHFAHFGLESGMLFEGTTGAYERNEKERKKEREIREFEMDFKKSLFVAFLT